MKHIFITICIVAATLLNGQDQATIDSLENLIAQTEKDSSKLEWYDLLRRQTVLNNPEIAKGYVEKYIEVATKLNLDFNQALGKTYMGNIQYAMGQYNDALESFFSAEKYFETNKDSIRLGAVYNGIAASYENSGSDSLTLKYFQKSFEIYSALKDRRRAGLARNNMGNIYQMRGDLETAIRYMEEAIDLLNEVQSRAYKDIVQINLANALSEAGSTDEANIIYRDALEEFDVHTNKYNYMMALKGLGSNHLKNENYSTAFRLLQEASTISKENNFRGERSEILKDYALVQEKLGRHEEALLSLNEYILLSDSIFSDEKDKNLNQALQQFESEKKNQKIELLNTQNELKDLKISRTNRQGYAMFLGLLLISLIAGLYYRLSRIRRKANAELEAKNEIIAQNLKEKETLLREIHHRVKNNLQVISSLLSLQSKYIDDPSALSAIKEGRDRVKSMALIHQNLYQEDDLTGIEVKEYFEKLVSSLFQSYNIAAERIQMEMQIEPLSLDVDTVIPLGLVANELISNALKHAFPNDRKGKITVQLTEKNEELLLAVKDTGVGLAPGNEKVFSENFGYKLIRTFQNKLNARLDLDTEEGTQVSLYIKDYKKTA